MEFYEAMNYRGWVKSFKMDELDTSVLDKVKNYAKYLRGLNADCADCFEIVKYSDIIRKHMGMFSTKAPYYLVIYMKDLEKELTNAGYLCGQLALYLTTKEIGSYVIGLEKVNDYLPMSSIVKSPQFNKEEPIGENAWVAIMGFGMPERKIRQVSKRINEMMVDKKCVYKSKVEPSIQKIMNASVYAPSKMLVRPYRYVVQDHRVHIYAKQEALMTTYQRVTFYLDLGIMLSYMGLKAEELWMTMLVKQEPKLVEKEIKHFSYMVSLHFEDQ